MFVALIFWDRFCSMPTFIFTFYIYTPIEIFWTLWERRKGRDSERQGRCVQGFWIVCWGCWVYCWVFFRVEVGLWIIVFTLCLWGLFTTIPASLKVEGFSVGCSLISCCSFVVFFFLLRVFESDRVTSSFWVAFPLLSKLDAFWEAIFLPVALALGLGWFYFRFFRISFSSFSGDFSSAYSLSMGVCGLWGWHYFFRLWRWSFPDYLIVVFSKAIAGLLRVGFNQVAYLFAMTTLCSPAPNKQQHLLIPNLDGIGCCFGICSLSRSKNLRPHMQFPS